jgi:hypothetical protein
MSDDFEIDVAAEPPRPPTAAGAPPSGLPTGPPPAWPEGWYADPWTAGQYRYWSGRTWTGATHRWGPANANAPGATTEAWPPPPRGYAVPTAAVTDVASPPPRRRGVVIAAAVALVAVLVASGAVGYAINANSQSDNAVTVTPPPSTTPPTTAPGATVSRDPDRAVLGGLGLRQKDVASTRTVLLYQKGNTLQEPTLDLCNAHFASERLRTARLQLVDADGAGDASLSTEAVLYKSPAAATQAFAEIRKARATCPGRPVTSPFDGTKEKTKFLPPPDVSWPDPPAEVQRLAYRMVTTANGQSSPLVTVYLRRGRALLGLYFPAPSGRQPAVAGRTSIQDIVQVFETRLAALSAPVVNRKTG